MPGYFKLKEYKPLFQNNPNRIDLTSEQAQHFGNPYSYDKQGNVVTVHTPIYLASLPDFLKDIRERMDIDVAQDHLLIGIISKGITEYHIVALHIPPNSEHYFAYDSKYSNPEQFFSPVHSTPQTIFEVIQYRINLAMNALTGLVQTLNPNAHKPRAVKEGSVVYNALGTQSFFDGDSCGYHCGSNLKLLAQLIHEGKEPTAELLLAATQSPAAESAQLLNHAAPGTVKLSFSAFLNKAWQDTFLPHIAEKERQHYHFGHYFMGWPSQADGSKIAYFATLKFITTPLVNLLSLVTEFPLNLISETASYLKNKLISFAPTNAFTQGIRSVLLVSAMGLQSIFKGLSLLIRTITSPIVSFKEAYKQHPALGYVSALASVILIGGGLAALAVFAPLVVATLAPSMGPGALALLSTLAAPALQVLAMMSLSVSVATAAVLTFISGGVVAGMLHLLGRSIIYPTPAVEQVPAARTEQSVGSNVSAHLPQSLDEEDFDIKPAPTQDDMIGRGLMASQGSSKPKDAAEDDFEEVFNPHSVQAKIGSK